MPNAWRGGRELGGRFAIDDFVHLLVDERGGKEERSWQHASAILIRAESGILCENRLTATMSAGTLL